jgi:hypothetical protein
MSCTVEIPASSYCYRELHTPKWTESLQLQVQNSIRTQINLPEPKKSTTCLQPKITPEPKLLETVKDQDIEQNPNYNVI